MDNYIKATPESGKEFYLNFKEKGEVIVMLNLLKFKAKADYSDLEAIKPQKEITGEQAFNLYSENTLGKLNEIGSEVLFYGASKNFLIGPESEKWDAVLLVKHQSVESFMDFAQSKTYLNNVGHRTAGLEDSRLLPTTEIKTTPSTLP